VTDCTLPRIWYRNEVPYDASGHRTVAASAG
jgi:hypothetical protein